MPIEIFKTLNSFFSIFINLLIGKFGTIVGISILCALVSSVALPMYIVFVQVALQHPVLFVLLFICLLFYSSPPEGVDLAFESKSKITPKGVKYIFHVRCGRRSSTKKKSKLRRRVKKLITVCAKVLEGMPVFQAAIESSQITAVLGHITRLCATILVISELQTKRARLAALYVYLCTFDTSLTEDWVMEHFSSFLDIPMPRSFQANILTDAHVATKSFKDGFSAILHGEMVTKVSRLVQAVTSYIACKQNSIDPSEGLRMFSEDSSAPISYSEVTLLSVALDAFECVLGRIVVYSESGDIVDLFTSNVQMKGVERKMVKVEANAAHVLIENFPASDYTDLAEYMSDIDTILSFLATETKRESSTHMRRYLNDKMVKICTIRNKLYAMMSARNLRVAPFTVLLYGDSGVGKSSLAATVMKQTLAANGFASSSENVAVLNLMDKYDSDYKPMHTGIILDDIANTKTTAPGYVNVSPKIIDLVNNVPKAALQAEAEKKGSIMLEPKVVIGTTNMKTLSAHDTSNEPASILRRFQYIVTVSVKPEYRVAGSSVIDPHKVDGCTDIWDLKVETVLVVPSSEGRHSTYQFVPAEGDLLPNGGLCNVSELLHLLRDKSIAHFKHQKLVVARSKAIYEKPLCEHNIIQEHCLLCNGSVFPSLPRAPEFQSSVLRDVMSMIFVRMIYTMPFIGHIHDWVHERHSFLPVVVSILGTICSLLSPVSFIMCLPFSLLFFMRSVIIYTNNVRLSIVAESWTRICGYLFQRLPSMRRKRQLVFFCVSLSVFLVLIPWIKSLYAVADPHFQGVSDGQPPVDDKEVKTSFWSKIERVDIPVSKQAATTSYSDLSNLLQPCVRHCSFDVAIDGATAVSVSDIFSICGDIWVMNKHTWDVRQHSDHITARVLRGPVEKGANSTRVSIYERDVYLEPDTDLVFFRFPSGGSVKDITPYFLQDKDVKRVKDLGGHILWRNASGVIEKIVSRNPVYNPRSALKGYPCFEHQLGKSTFSGLCGGVHICESKAPMILGIHFGGSANSNFAMTAPISSECVERARNHFRAQRTTVEFHSSGTLPTECGPVSFGPLEEPHFKAAINFLSEDAKVDFYGKHTVGRGTYHSDVVPSLISKDVEEILGKPCEHGPPPQMNHWRHFQRHLEAITHTDDHNVDIGFVDFAANDLLDDFLDNLKIDPQGASRIHPIDEASNLAGVAKVRFLDGVDLSTSIGWPFNKAKKNYIHESAPATQDSNRVLEMDNIIHEEILRIQTAYLSGERAYMTFRGNLKDEPTHISKDKVRVFAGAPFAFTFLVRKYFLPLVIYIQNHPIDFECAVGVNAHGPEWDELMRYVESKGKHRGVGGDYKAYDTKCSSTFLIRAYTILYRICEAANAYNGGAYTAQDLCIMRGLITDLCQPLYEHDGNILGVSGSNPSGHALTVIVNNVANSLYMRYAFYSLRTLIPDSEHLRFRENVSLLCYGDDNKMTVSEECVWFNHTAISVLLSSISVVYTMPDKTAESRAFVHVHSSDFLKRGSVLDQELGVYFAPLELGSIFKSLHCRNRASPTGAAKHAADALYGACVELFLHGKEEYDKHIEGLNEIVQKHDLHHHLPDDLLPSYEQARQNYLGKYYPTEESATL